MTITAPDKDVKIASEVSATQGTGPTSPFNELMDQSKSLRVPNDGQKLMDYTS